MAVSIRNLDVRMGYVLNTKCQPFYAPEEETVPVVQGAGWTLGPVRMGSRRKTFYSTQGFERKASQPVANAVPDTSFHAGRIILKCILQNCDTGVISLGKRDGAALKMI